MFIKKILLLLVLGFTHQELTSVAVIKIINNSTQEATCSFLEKKFFVRSGKTKNLALEIPFTSQEKNIIDAIVGRPYRPAETIEIQTISGTYYLWCDERGLICAQAFVRGMSRNEAFPQLFLALSYQEQSSIIGCIVTISKTGSLSIKRS